MKRLVYWFEIPSVNFKRAIKFYSTVLEMELTEMEFGDEKMACFPSGDGAISFCKGFNPSKDGVLVSLNTESDLDNTICRIEKNGGIIIQPKTKIQVEGRGYFAVFVDCEGNRVGLYGDNI